MNPGAGERMGALTLRRAIACAPLVACLAGCAVNTQLTPITIEPGCYAVQADGFPVAVTRATGLSGLPSFVALDSAIAERDGRRVIVPRNWSSAGRERHVYWTEELHGNRPASLVLTFAGPAGDLVATLEASGEGYAGPAAAGGPPSLTRAAQLRMTLTAVSCNGLRLEAEAPEP